ncbi:cupin domain-containing protein [Colwellia ponticola]|uniref:Cupin n=1 Tax=Colwellia ponticola TaxID=2304625 RepID=A0A8H2JIV5_9GAMM|nr:cupin domain-containing protein [Colwellia ponticola]TMM41974.1 cupin [Colwellia ponticola]
MEILADFSQRVIVHSALMDWIASPMPGVERRALDRVGGEVARATSIVRYAQGSHFSSHVHTGGEEFIVLDGVFQDEHGDYPAGSYVRNPPQSSHTPGAKQGCTIFVKLWQFQPEDRTHVSLKINKVPAMPTQYAGVSSRLLHQDSHEKVTIVDFSAHAKLSFTVPEGAEVLVLEGSLQTQGELLQKHSWMRLPLGDTLALTAQDEGAKVWLKIGNLADVENQIKRVRAVS